MAQGHTETTCKVSSPGSSGAKAQAVRYPILPPPWFVQGWDGRRLVYLGLERFFVFSMEKTCSGTSPGSGLCYCVVCTRLLFLFLHSLLLQVPGVFPVPTCPEM